MRSTTILAISLVSTVALAAPKPKADTKKEKEAKEHIDKATKAHGAGQFDVALSELQAAYKLDPKPDLLYAMGQVYSKLGRCTDATDSYEKFRAAKKDDAGISRVVDDAIAACKPVSTPFQDSQATEPAKTEPARTEPAKTEPAKTEPAKVETAPPPPVETAPPPPIEAKPAPEPAQPAPAAPHASAWYGDVVGDVLVVGGVAALVGAGIEYKGARSSLDDAENAMSLDSYNKLVDDAHSQRTVSLILGGAGAALIAGGLVHYMFHGKSAETHGVAIVPTSGGGLITLSGDL